MSYIVHRVHFGPAPLTATCGANLATPGHLGRRGPRPLVLPDETQCARGCYAKHRADVSADQIRLHEVTRPLSYPRHRSDANYRVGNWSRDPLAVTA